MAVALAVIISPLTGEVAENVIHLLREGHAAHADDADVDHDHAPTNDEHGCSGPFHVCACHQNGAFESVEGAQLGPPPLRVVDGGGAELCEPPAADVRALYRPPIG